MAYLEDIPKCALGTACKLAEDDLESLDFGCATVTSSSGRGGVGGRSQQCAARHDPPRQVRPMSRRQFKELVVHALRFGCRHLDCAPLYRTQPLVGEALRECRPQVPRQELFITSKVPPNMMRPEHLVRSVRLTIEELQVSYLDLVLLHAPFSTRHVRDQDFYPKDPSGQVLLDLEEGLLESAWRQLAELKRCGFTRLVGLSNVNIEQIDRLNEIHHVDVVQNEYHIYNQNRELFDHCEELDVHFEAYAIFGSPHKSSLDGKPNFTQDPIVQRIARAYSLSVASVNMQWIHQQPLSYVFGCDSADQWDENIRATRRQMIALNDLITLDSLNRNVRVFTFADEHMGLEKHREYPFELPAEQPSSTTGSKDSVLGSSSESLNEFQLVSGRRQTDAPAQSASDFNPSQAFSPRPSSRSTSSSSSSRRRAAPTVAPAPAPAPAFNGIDAAGDGANSRPEAFDPDNSSLESATPTVTRASTPNSEGTESLLLADIEVISHADLEEAEQNMWPS